MTDMLKIFAVVAAAIGVLILWTFLQKMDEPCSPTPDPSACVQAMWLDGAWRCIPTEQAG